MLQEKEYSNIKNISAVYWNEVNEGEVCLYIDYNIETESKTNRVLNTHEISEPVIDIAQRDIYTYIYISWQEGRGKLIKDLALNRKGYVRHTSEIPIQANS